MPLGVLKLSKKEEQVAGADPLLGQMSLGNPTSSEGWAPAPQSAHRAPIKDGI